MKILRVFANNKKKVFAIHTKRYLMEYPYSKLKLKPSNADPVVSVISDPEAGNEAFTYALLSGKEDTIHIDSVLFHNKDSDYLCRIHLHNLTVEAIEAIERSGISKREVARSLKTSPRQLYRLLDPAYYGKTINQMLKLLHALGRDVEIQVKRRA